MWKCERWGLGGCTWWMYFRCVEVACFRCAFDVITYCCVRFRCRNGLLISRCFSFGFTHLHLEQIGSENYDLRPLASRHAFFRKTFANIFVIEISRRENITSAYIAVGVSPPICNAHEKNAFPLHADHGRMRRCPHTQDSIANLRTLRKRCNTHNSKALKRKCTAEGCMHANRKKEHRNGHMERMTVCNDSFGNHHSTQIMPCPSP